MIPRSSSTALDEERPVSVSAECARAILAGAKTMLRQVALDATAPCPVGGPGSVLWVREPWMPAPTSGFLYGGSDAPPADASWLPARDMPRDASRIRLRVLAVRLEPLQDIPAADFELEGALWRAGSVAPGAADRSGFARWWDRLHPRPGTQWADNPLVWVVTFAVDETAAFARGAGR